jgi:hypothetical protein
VRPAASKFFRAMVHLRYDSASKGMLASEYSSVPS